MGNSINGCNYPVFNEQYEILQLLSTGKAAHVYKGRSLEDPKTEVAIKINKKSYMKQHVD